MAPVIKKIGGRRCTETTPPLVAKLREVGIGPLQELLPTEVFRTLWPGKRRSWAVLVPEVVFWLMTAAALGDGSMTGAVVGFWSTLRAMLPSIAIEPITEEAFCQARKRLPLEFFRKVFYWVVARFASLHEAKFLWKGHTLKGVDGMKTLLPHSKELQERYPTPSNQHGGCGRPQGLIVGLLGLFTGICYGFIPLSGKGSEPRAGCFLARLLKAGDLLLADANFTGIQMFLSIIRPRADFLMRLACNRYVKYIRRPTASGRSDEYYIDIPIPAPLKALFPHVGDTLTVRVLEYQIKGYRLSRLITSLLDVERYPHDELVALYHDRWRQETHHREWKCSLQVANLRSRTRKGILKEIFVQLTLNNLVRWTQAEAVKAPLRPVDLQFLACKRLLIATIYPLAHALANDDVPSAAVVYNQLLQAIATKRILVRPGRSYPRQHDAVPRNKGNGAFAQPARLPESEEAAMPTI